MGAVKEYFTDPDSVFFRRDCFGNWTEVNAYLDNQDKKSNAQKIRDYFKKKGQKNEK